MKISTEQKAKKTETKRLRDSYTGQPCETDEVTNREPVILATL